MNIAGMPPAKFWAVYALLILLVWLSALAA